MNKDFAKRLNGGIPKILINRMHKVFLMCRITKIRIKAAKKIQSFFRGYLVRKDLSFIRSPKISLLLKWLHPAESVFIAGNFTQPQWSYHVPLTYNKYLGYFYSTYLLDNHIEPRRYYCKFLVDGNWVCNEKMETAEDLGGNANNVVTWIKDKRYVPRAHSTRNLVPESLGICKTLPKSEIHRVLSVENNSLLRPVKLKKTEPSAKKIKLCFGYHMAGHPKNRFAPLDSQNSADACFIDNDLQIFGVADGVGEWETFGLDPGLFPKELMKNFRSEFIQISEQINKITNEEIPNLLKNCLNEAFIKTKNYGSSTVLLGLNKDNKIYTIAIGDSGFIVFRSRKDKEANLVEVFRSIEQQHAFNCPYQLACFPKEIDYDILLKKGFGSFVSLLKRSNLSIQDLPQDAHVQEFEIEPNDIIIAATDGLFDNLFDQDIHKLCEAFLTYDLEPENFCERLSKELVAKAVQKGWDPAYKSPFSKNAANYGQRFIGGKLDDTTVIVALAQEI